MAANEIAERIAAHAWLRLGPQVSDVAALDDSSIGFRSQVGFIERVITTTDAKAYPLLILELDRELVRTENQVLAYTVGSVDALGRSYPQPELGNAARLPNVEAIHTSWIGNYAAPSWLPFNGDPVPDYAARDLNVFNAIALLLPAGELAYAGDVCVLALRSPIGGPWPAAAPVIPPPSPVAKFYHYFAPGTPSAEGTVTVWPDTGDLPHVDLPSEATHYLALFDSSPLLNDLAVIAQIVGGTEQWVYSDALNFAPGTFSFSLVAARESGVAYALAWLIGSDAATIGVGLDNGHYAAAGWFAGTSLTPGADRKDLGDASVLALAFTANADGTWAATYQLDWGDVQTTSGTWDSSLPIYWAQVGGFSAGTTTFQSGEVRLYSATSWNEAAREAQLAALRLFWQGVKLWEYDPAPLAAGPVASIADTGNDPLIAATPAFVNTPTAIVSPSELNAQMTVRYQNGGPIVGETLGASFIPRAGGLASAGACLPSTNITDQTPWSLETDDGDILRIHADSDGHWYLETDADQHDLGLQNGAFAWALSVADNGDFELSYSIGWTADATITGTLTLPTLPFRFIYMGGGSATTIYNGRIRTWNSVRTSLQLTAEIDSLRAIYEPPPIFP